MLKHTAGREFDAAKFANFILAPLDRRQIINFNLGAAKSALNYKFKFRHRYIIRANSNPSDDRSILQPVLAEVEFIRELYPKLVLIEILVFDARVINFLIKRSISYAEI